MVNFTNFDEFLNTSTHLYLSNPFTTRYSTSISIKSKRIILKVTDDINTYKYKTDQSNELHCIERLTLTFMRLMTATIPTEDLINVEEEAPVVSSAPSKKKK